jgi:hypothetical protein
VTAPTPGEAAERTAQQQQEWIDAGKRKTSHGERERKCWPTPYCHSAHPYDADSHDSDDGGCRAAEERHYGR